MLCNIRTNFFPDILLLTIVNQTETRYLFGKSNSMKLDLKWPVTLVESITVLF